MPNPVILSGANGYIGRNLVGPLQQRGIDFTTLGAERTSTQPHPLPQSSFQAGRPILVHLAGAAGRPSVKQSDQERAGRAAEQAINLAEERDATSAILASSIYATLAETGRGGEYGAHKLEIERLFASRFRARLIILRLPPIYGGEGDRSSVSKLAQLVRLGFPLPLGKATARRDYLAMSNLLDLLLTIIETADTLPNGPNPKIYEPCDGNPHSTSELVRQLAAIFGVPARLLSVPAPAVEWLLKAVGRGGLAEGAFLPLRAEGNARLTADLGWRPSTSMPESLTYLTRKTAT